MKIGIYNPYLDDLGGGEKYMMTIAECLSAKHDVSVFWDNQEDVKELLERFLIDLSNVTFAKNIFSRSVSTLERLLETMKFDAVVVLSDGSIPFVLSKRLFLHFQQPMIHVSAKSAKTRFKLSRVTSIFCNSHFTKSFVDRSFNVSSRVIYPPVDLYPKKIKKENIILTVGRLRVRDYKKHGVMIKSFKKMVDMGLRGWKFVLGVSAKEENREAFAQIQKSAEGFPIEFVVNKNNKELWDVYNRAKIYWHAAGFGEDLEKHPEYAEHFGISTVEAMGAGAVPVVINAGGQREIVKDGQNGFLWNTPEELKKKTMFLIDNPKKLQELSYKAQEKTKDFSRERFCREIEELISE